MASHSGRLAAKASIDQLVMLADTGILDALRGRITYLLLEREDRLGQAISRVIAAQNLRWTTTQESKVPESGLMFDRAWIKNELAELAVRMPPFRSSFEPMTSRPSVSPTRRCCPTRRAPYNL